MYSLRGSVLLTMALVTLSCGAGAQVAAPPEPQNLVRLSATGTVEAQQDWLSVVLSITRQGSDASTVQNQLREALESAESALKKTAQPGAMEVHSGAFNLLPRLGKDGKITGWIGSSELILEGSDFSRISIAAAKAQPLVISSLGFGLSRAARSQLETQAQTLAIDSFKRKAAQIAQGFGFAGYTLREVSIGAVSQMGEPMQQNMDVDPRAMAAASRPLPVESGKSAVGVIVSGSLQLK